MRANVGRSVPTVGISPSGIKQHKLNGVHMKYTSLFSAVAIAAAMGTQALATVTTNNVAANSINFEGASYPVGTMRAAQLTGWTVQNEDLSEIIYAPLSSADAVEGYTANKHVKLNTEGNELKWEPSSMTTNKAIIEMKVRLVASDTAPAISDPDVHAAVYLQVSDPVDATKDGLYAYATVEGANAWTKLDTSAFNHDLATGDMVALRVVMDYAARTATYEGALLADAENDTPTYYGLGETAMANPADAKTQGQLASISFKGTGGIDDLFVGEIVETPSTATITLQEYDGEDWQEVETGSVDTADPLKNFTSSLTIPAGKEVTVTVCDASGNELATLTTADVVDSLGNFEVSCDDYAFRPDTEYLIRVLYTDPVANFTVTFTTDRGTAPADQTVQSGSKATNPGAPAYEGSDYTFVEWQLNGAEYDFDDPVTGNITLTAVWQAASAPAEGVEFGTFVIGDGAAQFTAFSVSGTTATATLSANIESTGTQTQKPLYAKYETALGSGSYSYAAATVTAQTAGEPGSVTFTFTVPAGNSLFLVGLSNEDGSN